MIQVGGCMDVRVVNNVEASRYEAYVGVELAGFSEYRIRPDVIVFTHTEVDDAFEGKGVGSALSRGARSTTSGRTEAPSCRSARSSPATSPVMTNTGI